jgi:hypothetical protein
MNCIPGFLEVKHRYTQEKLRKRIKRLGISYDWIATDGWDRGKQLPEAWDTVCLSKDSFSQFFVFFKQFLDRINYWLIMKVSGIFLKKINLFSQERLIL